MRVKTIKVRLGSRSYDILIGKGLLASCGGRLKSVMEGGDAVVITNRRLWTLYRKPLERLFRSAGLTFRFMFIPDSEKAKSIRTVSRVIDEISRYDVRKKIFIAAFGGGVVGDVAGFVAATYKRGIPYIQIPTTLLAQVDSAIGGKTAVDLPEAKNMVGAFHQPGMVISDIGLLRSLPANQIRNGMAEVIKYGVIKDPALFCFLEKNCEKILGADERSLEFIITRSSSIKADLVARDEFDKKKVRAVLNFGHTLGHAIESASGYAGYSHGEAIAIGMVIASDIACRLGMMARKDLFRIAALIGRFGLPTRIKKHMSFSGICKSYMHDKKFINKTNRLVLPMRIGLAKVVDTVPDGVIKKALKESLL